MKAILEDLEAQDSRENHLKTLENVILVYLTSEEANCRTERTNALLLLGTLRRLFV